MPNINRITVQSMNLDVIAVFTSPLNITWYFNSHILQLIKDNPDALAMPFGFMSICDGKRIYTIEK